MKTSTSLAGMLAAGMIFCLPAAQADGIGFQTSLSNMTLGVADLTPNDDIAAHFSYTFASSSYVTTIYRSGRIYDRIWDTTAGLNPVDHVVNFGASSAAVQATGNFGEISLQGQALSNLGWDGSIETSALQTYTVTLGAHSALTLSGHMFQQIAPLTDPNRYQYGSSDLRIRFKSDDLPHSGGYTSFRRSEQPGVADRDLWLAYANPTDQDVTVALTIDANSVAYITPVPEPSTYAMLGLGLLAVGAFARRSSNRQEGKAE